MFAVLIGDPQFALRVADNKLMLMWLVVLQDWNRHYGDDVSLAQPNEFHSIMKATMNRLIENAKNQSDLTEIVLEKRFPKLSLSFFSRFGRRDLD